MKTLGSKPLMTTQEYKQSLQLSHNNAEKQWWLLTFDSQLLAALSFGNLSYDEFFLGLYRKDFNFTTKVKGEFSRVDG
jgi:phage baseplate assembly protein gpV